MVYYSMRTYLYTLIVLNILWQGLTRKSELHYPLLLYGSITAQAREFDFLRTKMIFIHVTLLTRKTNSTKIVNANLVNNVLQGLIAIVVRGLPASPVRQTRDVINLRRLDRGLNSLTAVRVVYRGILRERWPRLCSQVNAVCILTFARVAQFPRILGRSRFRGSPLAGALCVFLVRKYF